MRTLFQSHSLQSVQRFLFVGHAVEVLGEHHIFECGEIRNQVKLLKHETDFLCAHAIQFSRRDVGHIFAIQPNLARR